MRGADGWGREQGRETFQRLLRQVEGTPETTVFRVSLEGVNRVDISFASETVVELARRYRPAKGFCLTDAHNRDMIENWEAAAERKNQPLTLREHGGYRVIGCHPSQGNADALKFALEREEVRATEFAAVTSGMTIANASNKFKQLWEQGFLLRTERTAETGGVEFAYRRIG